MSPIRSASQNNGKQWPIIREAEREWAPASCNLGSSALRFVRITFGRWGLMRKKMISKRLCVPAVFPGRLRCQRFPQVNLALFEAHVPYANSLMKVLCDDACDAVEIISVLVLGARDRYHADAEVRQRVAACRICGDALCAGVYGIAVVFDGDVAVWPKQVADKIMPASRSPCVGAQRQTVVQLGLWQTKPSFRQGKRKRHGNPRLGR